MQRRTTTSQAPMVSPYCIGCSTQQQPKSDCLMMAMVSFFHPCVYTHYRAHTGTTTKKKGAAGVGLNDLDAQLAALERELAAGGPGSGSGGSDEEEKEEEVG